MQENLLIIGTTWPEPQATAAGGRMQRLIAFFLDEGYQITFASTSKESALSMDLEALGVLKQSILLNDKSFNDFIKGLRPDIVLFDRFPIEEQFGWRVAEFAPKALRILDTEDLHSLRHSRHGAFKKGFDFNVDAWLQNTMTKREIASIYRSDLSLVISSYEMYLLKDVIQMDEAILEYLPFLLDPILEDETKIWNGFENRADFVCIGNGKHAPNVNAVVWLKTEIWPLIRKQLPQANLKIYGAYLPERVLQMHRPEEGFMVEGWAKDVKVILNEARVNLAPLRFGAGLKGKLITTMQNGVPSVTTSIGAEGLHAPMPFWGSIADTASNFADAAIDLYTNHSLWQNAQDNGIDGINKLYDKTKYIDKLRSKITAVKSGLEVHRTKNFIGAMLRHQSMASTKYMAKWIESKNT